jgi:hypothetical protein
VLLALSMTSRLLDNPDTRFINSCAVPNHPMIDHLWPDRLEMMDLMVGVGGKSDGQFLTAASLEGGRRKLRSFAKNTYYKMRGLTPS